MQLEWFVLGALLLALLADHFVVWRAFERAVTLDAAKERRAWRMRTAAVLWSCAALVLALWAARGWPPNIFSLPSGWRFWAPLAVVIAVLSLQAMGAIKISRASGDKSRLRKQMGSTARVMPHDRSELPGWLGISLTAGFCEELVFRGFLIWMLQPFAGWWVAAGAALAVFAAAHAYQGASGVVRSALAGALMTAIVFVSQTLWLAIVLHAALDWMGGCIAWLILREPEAQ